MTGKRNKEATRERILSACVKLFLEKGYKKTTFKDILTEAHATSGAFYNIYAGKDSVLLALTDCMFENQFDMAERIAGFYASPAELYSVETGLQLALAEMNENLRELYVEAYTSPENEQYIRGKTALKLKQLFAQNMKKAADAEFQELEIGTAGLMRSYMAVPCTEEFTLKKKIRYFLSMALPVYNVPKKEQEAILEKMEQIDMEKLALDVMEKLFDRLSMHFNFELSGSMMPKRR